MNIYICAILETEGTLNTPTGTMQISGTPANTYRYTCIYIYIHVYTCIYIHIYMCVFIYIYIHTCKFIYMCDPGSKRCPKIAFIYQIMPRDTLPGHLHICTDVNAYRYVYVYIYVTQNNIAGDFCYICMFMCVYM